jgi:2-polyprenyl-6-methoxyphenol hydroxylase-like FAD-dependent oxidoreductase
MLLARSGYRVLLVDKATFPSDTMSTHLVHPPGVAALARWGILKRLESTGCPPITRYSFDFGPVTISGSPRPAGGASNAYGPRRIVLDALLVEAAVAAGAELREAFTVEEILVDDGRVTGIRGRAKGGSTVTERARVVVGADGKHSQVAKAAQPERYNEVRSLAPLYYAYWSGLPVDAFETYIRAEDGRGWAALPTHGDLTCVVQGWPQSQFAANRRDLEGTYMKSFELAPKFAERLNHAKRETRFVGTGDLPGFFRKPYGPGWALVGDAGYHKDPITAQGMADAFRDADLLADAVDRGLEGDLAAALAGYQQARDAAALPIYEFTCGLADIAAPPTPEMLGLVTALDGNSAQISRFLGLIAGSTPIPEFFSPESVGQIMAEAINPAA